ncbi:hypothetical protein G9A89_017242 [Geosiphon pyriformis]|nr:hypothetical protein G9A89_017242 [Geosiphon pyriformis]
MSAEKYKVKPPPLSILSVFKTNLRTSTNSNHPKVAESEIIETNHLEFTKYLFQQYSQQLELNNNYFPVESAFNFYVNDKITDNLGGTVDIKFTRENFYTELFQHTSLPRNHSFTPIIKKINQTIERYTQQQFFITYADKGKKRLQTPVVTPKQIQPPTWKKTKVESPTNPSYHYTPESTINISSTGTSTESRVIRTIQFWSPLFQPDFGITSSWEITESEGKQEEKEEEESENQEFVYQNPILENSEIETPNIQTPPNLNNPNPELINQQNLPPVIPQQLLQPSAQQQQQPNLDPIAYAPIAKLDNFISKENDTQVWLNDVEKAINLVVKSQTFNDFKTRFLRYFSNNNSINCLTNTFTTIKQRDTEAVTTYLEHFHRNLRQIQAI